MIQIQQTNSPLFFKFDSLKISLPSFKYNLYDSLVQQSFVILDGNLGVWVVSCPPISLRLCKLDKQTRDYDHDCYYYYCFLIFHLLFRLIYFSDIVKMKAYFPDVKGKSEDILTFSCCQEDHALVLLEVLNARK